MVFKNLIPIIIIYLTQSAAAITTGDILILDRLHDEREKRINALQKEQHNARMTINQYSRKVRKESKVSILVWRSKTKFSR